MKNKEKMKKQEKGKIKELIKKGKWDYVLTYGSRYAIGMFLVYWFFTKFILEEKFDVGFNMIIWGIAGLVVGFLGWKKINKNSK